MNDPRTVRLVAGFCGIIVLAVVVGSFVLLLEDKGLDPALVGLGGTALGGLIGLLVPTRADAQPVIVENRPSEPVPVEAAKLMDAGHADVTMLAVGLILGLLLALVLGPML